MYTYALTREHGNFKRRRMRARAGAVDTATNGGSGGSRPLLRCQDRYVVEHAARAPRGHVATRMASVLADNFTCFSQKKSLSILLSQKALTVV
jgi:hypothetical protein